MKILVLDGNSIINRAFYGIRLLTTKNGEFTNAIYGFLNILNRLTEQEKPDAIAVAFDLKTPTFRHEMYDGYKAGRKGMPDELAAQMPLLKDILRLRGIKVLECEGFEADDILGTLARIASEQKWQCAIATGDRDSLQLVRGEVCVLLAATKMGQPQLTVYNEEKINEEYGVEPTRLKDIKALMGDSSDNIPGVAGVGQKTALDLVQRFGSIDEIYKNIDTLDIRDTLRLKLKNGEESARMSYILGTIVTNVPVSETLDDYKIQGGDPQKLAAMLARLELFKLIERWQLDKVQIMSNEDKSETEKTADCIFEPNLDAVANILNDGKKIFFTYICEKNQIDTIGFSCNDKTIIITKNNTEYTEIINTILSGKISVYTHDIKKIYNIFEKAENCKFDSMLGAYLLNPSASAYDLPRLFQEYAVKLPSVKNVPKEFSEFASQAAAFQILCEKLEENLQKNEQLKLLNEIEIPLARVLSDMEKTGFLINADKLIEFGKFLADDIEKLRSGIFEMTGFEFNLNSPKQLGEALFEKLEIPTKKKTKTGYSTSADVLESLRYDYPVVDAILEYRQRAKLHSTYVEGMISQRAEDGRIHSTLNQTETRTGRISSTEPNLQNIPVRKELGRELRRFFTAKEGYVLCDADYSQIELRVLAHMADDKNMINAFLNNADIHTSTAAQVFNMPAEMVTPLMRSRAKAVNFGIVYGIGAFSLSKDLKISFSEAKSYIKSYMATYLGVADYMEKVVAQAKENSFVTTLFGRRRYLPELNSSNANMRAFGERVARNMPVQGTAADIIKIAMINVSKAFENEKMKSKLIMQVHDELIVEAPEAEAEKAAEIMKNEMENAVKLAVPMTVDVHKGKTWYDAKG